MTPPEFAPFAENLARVQERMAGAAARVGRAASDITLVAVTKKQSVETIAQALAAGVTNLGENYVQEAGDKQAVLGRNAAQWHLIGHLQGNKARAAAGMFDLIQGVDSVSLACALGRRARALGKTQAVLLQVHLGTEATKSGFAPEEALDAAAEAAQVPGIAVQGLMGIAPAGEDARPFFRQLRRLFDGLPPAHRQTLSMGMTGDFEDALAEGATMIRVGTALFGPRPTGRR